MFVGLTDFVKRGVLTLVNETPYYRNYHCCYYFVNGLTNDVTRSEIHGIQLLPNQTEIFLMLFADDLGLLFSTVMGLPNQLIFTL